MTGLYRRAFATATALVAIALVAASANASNLASDNAGNYATWSSGDNLGSGFGAWTLGSSGSSGQFLGASTGNAGGSAGIDTAGQSWGFYSSGGNVADALRPFTGGALSIGQTFSIDIDQGFQDTGSTVGLGLQNAAGNNLFEMYYIGGDSVNSWKKNDAAGQADLSPNVGFTGNGLRLQVTLTSASTYSGTLTTLNPTGSPVAFSGTLAAGGGDQLITRVRLFNFNAGAGGNNDTFFNSMSIIPEPTTITLVGLGLLGAFAVRRRKA